MTFFSVDIYVRIFYFKINFNKRHVSKNTDIAFWKLIHINYINEKNKHILQKNNHHLNQKDVLTLVKCIEIEIPLNPILYIQTSDDIKFILDMAIVQCNVKCVNKINDEYRLYNILTKEEIQDYVTRCCISSCYINLLKWFYKVLGIRKHHFAEDINLCMSSCSHENFIVFKYFHKVFGYTRKDMQQKNNMVLIPIIYCGNLYFLHYLHKNVKFTKEDFDNVILGCSNNYTQLITYFCEFVGCESGNLNIINLMQYKTYKFLFL